MGLVGFAWAAKAGTFRATGTATFVSQDTSGKHFVFSHVGRSNPGGSFTGGVVGHTTATFQKQSGTLTFDYGVRGRAALERFFAEAFDKGLIPNRVPVEFV